MYQDGIATGAEAFKRTVLCITKHGGEAADPSARIASGVQIFLDCSGCSCSMHGCNVLLPSFLVGERRYLSLILEVRVRHSVTRRQALHGQHDDDEKAVSCQCRYQMKCIEGRSEIRGGAIHSKLNLEFLQWLLPFLDGAL